MVRSRGPVALDEAVGSAFHDLCQPLATLRCRLEIAMMQQDHGTTHPEELCEAVQGGLQDLRQVFESVERLRQALLEETQAGVEARSRELRGQP